MVQAGSVDDQQRQAMAAASRAWVQERLASLEILVSPARPVADNLATDESMLERAAEEGRTLLRLWWGEAAAVVVGHSETPEVVADLAACARLGVPVLRRRSGGGTVLQTDGVLNYSLTAPSARLLDVNAVFALGGRILVAALARLGLEGHVRGTSDVVVGERKISGNAQARRRGGVLVHGTLLRDLDLDLVEACLRHPPREPDYRRGRPHREFITTLLAEGVAAAKHDVEAAVAVAALDLAREGEVR